MSDVDYIDNVEVLPIPGASRYRVGRDGSVWNTWDPSHRDWNGPWRKLNHSVHIRGGHHYIWITYDDGKRRCRYSHQLVLEAFVGPKPEGLDCRHIDGDPTNNNLDNLCWDTHHANMRDQWDSHGTGINGERVYGAKLTEDDVREIRRLYSIGVRLSDLRRQFGCTIGNVHAIVNRRSWKHV